LILLKNVASPPNSEGVLLATPRESPTTPLHALIKCKIFLSGARTERSDGRAILTTIELIGRCPDQREWIGPDLDL
jgi:hypothetical protein